MAVVLMRQRANEASAIHPPAQARQVLRDANAGQSSSRNGGELAANLAGASGLRSNVSEGHCSMGLLY